MERTGRDRWERKAVCPFGPPRFGALLLRDEVPSDQPLIDIANPGARTGLGRPVRCFVSTPKRAADTTDGAGAAMHENAKGSFALRSEPALRRTAESCAGDPRLFSRTCSPRKWRAGLFLSWLSTAESDAEGTREDWRLPTQSIHTSAEPGEASPSSSDYHAVKTMDSSFAPPVGSARNATASGCTGNPGRITSIPIAARARGTAPRALFFAVAGVGSTKGGRGPMARG